MGHLLATSSWLDRRFIFHEMNNFHFWQNSTFLVFLCLTSELAFQLASIITVLAQWANSTLDPFPDTETAQLKIQILSCKPFCKKLRNYQGVKAVKRLSMQAPEHASTWAFKDLSMRVPGHTTTSARKHMSTQTPEHASTWASKHLCMQTPVHANNWACKRLSKQTPEQARNWASKHLS